jgi:hypothetical protein
MCTFCVHIMCLMSTFMHPCTCDINNVYVDIMSKIMYLCTILIIYVHNKCLYVHNMLRHVRYNCMHFFWRYRDYITPKCPQEHYTHINVTNVHLDISVHLMLYMTFIFNMSTCGTYPNGIEDIPNIKCTQMPKLCPHYVDIPYVPNVHMWTLYVYICPHCKVTSALGRIWLHSVAFGCIRSHSVAFVGIYTYLVAFGRINIQSHSVAFAQSHSVAFGRA